MYDHLEEHISCASLPPIDSPDNLWKSANDINWLKSTPSPNWVCVDEKSRRKYQLFDGKPRYVLTESQGESNEHLLEDDLSYSELEIKREVLT
jgi:hypothetical protein